MSDTERLEEYFDFTQDDLRENRKGIVTEDQRLILKEKTQRETNVLLIAFVAIGIISVVIGNIINPGSNSMMMPVILGIMAVVIIVLRGIKRSDISLHSVEGKIEFFWEEHKVKDSDSVNYLTTRKILKVRIGEKVFEVREELMDILEQGDRCRFYYTGGGDILSAEVLNRR